MSYISDLRERAVYEDAAFAEYMTEGQLVFPRHLREASVFADTHNDCVILLPRGHAKTTLFIYRLARRIGQTRGRRRIGILTAVSNDATRRSTTIRELVEHPLFADVFGWARAGVQGDPWTDASWTVAGANLGKDSTCFAVGLQAARAGARFDDLLADDVVGKQENDTFAQREKAKETYLSVVDPMLVPGGTRTFLGTRWHEDDIYAFLTKTLGWPVLLRKAIAEDGTALWPDYWGIERLTEKRAELGSAIFDLQYQNDPRGMGGNIFKREWFHPIDALPERVLRRVGMDLASSRTERSDYTAVSEWAEDAAHNLYLCGAWRARLDEGHRAWLTGRTDSMEPGARPEYGHLDGPRLLWPLGMLPPLFAGARGDPSVPRMLHAVNIEATQHQSTFVREVLAKTRLPALPVYPDSDKVSRARALAARAEAGKVFYLRGAPGVEEFINECVAFPNGEHDDLVDSGVMGADLGGVEFSYAAGRR